MYMCKEYRYLLCTVQSNIMYILIQNCFSVLSDQTGLWSRLNISMELNDKLYKLILNWYEMKVDEIKMR